MDEEKMRKIRLNKTELTKQKDALKRLQRFLPMLQLKKKQLQWELHRILKESATLKEERNSILNNLRSWGAVIGEEANIKELIKIKELKTRVGCVAGVKIPRFQDIAFEQTSYDLFTQPPWVDTAIEVSQSLLELKEKLKIVKDQLGIVLKELRATTQRVNLFEKIKIPQNKNSIKRIRIYLGDQEIAAVVRGKIAKKKVKTQTRQAQF